MVSRNAESSGTPSCTPRSPGSLWIGLQTRIRIHIQRPPLPPPKPSGSLSNGLSTDASLLPPAALCRRSLRPRPLRDGVRVRGVAGRVAGAAPPLRRPGTWPSSCTTASIITCRSTPTCASSGRPLTGPLCPMQCTVPPTRPATTSEPPRRGHQKGICRRGKGTDRARTKGSPRTGDGSTMGPHSIKQL